LNFYLNNTKEIGKVHYSRGLRFSPWPQWHIGLGSSCMAQPGGLWPARAGGRAAGALPGLTLHAHGTRSSCRARRAHLHINGDLMTTRFTACPPPRLKLHAATPTPQWRWPKRGPHRSSGGSVVMFGVEVGKWLQTRIEAPGLGSLASQASHER
jgi:hypothetical protein